MEQNEQTAFAGQEHIAPNPVPQAVPQQAEPQQPVYEQPVYQQPVYQQPTYQQPVYQQPTYQQPTYQQPTYQQPTYQQPTYPQPVYQQPTYQQPAYPQPVYQQPTYQQPAYPQPVYQQPVHPQIAAAQAQVAASADKAFAKSLASVIMAGFPVASIIAIFSASSGLRHSKASNNLAAQYGLRPHGKSIAAKVLGTIGLIGSIILTVYWAIYFLALIFSIGSLIDVLPDGSYYF